MPCTFCFSDLYLDSSVPVLAEPPSSLEFYRDWVSPNKPVVIKQAFKDWPALECWDQHYLRFVS